MAKASPMPEPKTARTAGAAALAGSVFPRIRIGQLARQLDVDPETVRRWARGLAVPPAAKLAALEDLLGIPMRAWTEDAPSAPVLDDGDEESE